MLYCVHAATTKSFISRVFYQVVSTADATSASLWRCSPVAVGASSHSSGLGSIASSSHAHPLRLQKASMSLSAMLDMMNQLQ